MQDFVFMQANIQNAPSHEYHIGLAMHSKGIQERILYLPPASPNLQGRSQTILYMCICRHQPSSSLVGVPQCHKEQHALIDDLW